jgi:uncharacterized protein YndB with AHSA1/START domain
VSSATGATWDLAYELSVVAPPGHVFAVLTHAEHIARWFCDEAEIEPGVGGKIVMRWHRPGAVAYEGQWVAFDPPRACAHEGGNHAYPDGYSGRVGFALAAEAGGGTRLSILHQLPARAEYEPIIERYRGAWPRAIARLEAYLSLPG